jgi:hypothetical protein
MNLIVHPLFRIALAVLLVGASGVAAAAVTASLDRDEVAPGDTVVLTLQRDSHGGGDPDLGPLKKDFDVLDSSSGTSIQFVNGSMSAQRQLRLTLAPKHGGKIELPAISWDGEQSAPLQLTVADGGAAGGSGNGAASGATAGSAAGGAAGAGNGHVFFTTALDQQQPYVQGAVLMTLRLYFDQPIYQAGLEFSGNNDVLVQALGKDHQDSETRNGRRYDVIERHYLLQPQRSGTLSLDGPTLQAEVADSTAQDPFGGAFGGSPFGGMMRTTRPLRLHGEAIQLDVRPRPANAAGPDWLPARRLTLEQSSKPDGSSIHAGEPLTLHLRLSANGLSGAQLPDLAAELSLPDGVKAYPDQPKLDTSLQNGEIVGTREQDIALIADRPGQYHLPALRLPWWDLQQNAQRFEQLPERTLEVLPAAGGAALAPPPPATANSTAPADAAAATPAAFPGALGAAGPASRLPWPWISLALGLLWLATLAAWWLQRRRAPSIAVAPRQAPVAAPVDSSAARTAFRRDCQAGDAPGARRALLAWARAEWPQRPPPGLQALAQRLQRPELLPLFDQLDRACYCGEAWNGEALALALAKLEAPAEKAGKAPLLADLYP